MPMHHRTNVPNAIPIISRGIHVAWRPAYPKGSQRTVRTGDNNCIVRKGEQLIARDVDHSSAHRIVRNEEAGVDQRHVVLLNAVRYQRGKQEVPICASCTWATLNRGRFVAVDNRNYVSHQQNEK